MKKCSPRCRTRDARGVCLRCGTPRAPQGRRPASEQIAPRGAGVSSPGTRKADHEAPPVVPPPASPPPSTPPPASTHATPATSTLGARADAIAAALGAASAPAAAAAPAGPPPLVSDEERRQKVVSLAKLGAKFANLGTLGLTAWAVRQLRPGREPGEPDEDAERVFVEGCEWKLTEWFGSASAGPWSMMGLGLAVNAATMAWGSTPIEKTNGARAASSPAAHRPSERRDDSDRGSVSVYTAASSTDGT